MPAAPLPDTAATIGLAGIQADLLFAATQVAKTVLDLPSTTSFPRSGGDSGSWSTVSAYDWTSGFFPGELWLLYQATGDTAWRDKAASWTASLASQATRTDTHDLGFMIGSSFGNGYRLTGDPSYLAVINQAATSLATRFSPVVGAIRSWDTLHFPVIIDNMMNLTPLLWGAQHGGDPAWTAIATTHANTTIANLIRPDGSTYQLADFDPITGALIKQQTYQGYSDSSTWARGQAWAIHGFTDIYQATRNPAYLAAAEKTANYFISHLPSDFVPYWDFAAPVTPTTPRDSSAAAVAADALTELSTLADVPADQQTYLGDALKILAALSGPAYLGPTTGASILQHATGGATFEIDTALIYGDYYFTSALLRAQLLLRGQPLWTQYDPATPSGGLIVSVAEDAWQGDAQYTISLDGQQVGGVRTATASHAAGQSQAITVAGTLSPGTHSVAVTFLNDAYDGPGADRNLYVTGATYAGQSIPGSTVPLYSGGTASFSLGTGPAAAGGLVISVSEDAWRGDAQFTISIDGQQSGGIRTATASHAGGQTQAVSVEAALSPGAHQISVTFLNDAYDGPGADRNLYLDAATYGGQTIPGSTAGLYSGGATAGFTLTAPAQGQAVVSTLTLNMSEDAWMGDAQFIVTVDGRQQGGTYTATASHAAGQSQAFTIGGIAESFTPHDVAVSFLNDGYGRAPGADRNLYVDSIQFDRQLVPNGSAALYSTGTQHFTLAAPVNWTG